MSDPHKAVRAKRFASIREKLKVTQAEMAERMNAAGKELGIDSRYEPNDISTRENDRRALEIEDYVIASAVDPERRSWFWFAFGRDMPKAMFIQRPPSRKQSAES